MIEADDFVVELLLSHGLVSDEQVEQARERAAQESGGGTTVSTLEGLYILKAIEEKEVVQLLASEYGMDTYDFDSAEKKVPQEVVDLLPPDVARLPHDAGVHWRHPPDGHVRQLTLSR